MPTSLHNKATQAMELRCNSDEIFLFQPPFPAPSQKNIWKYIKKRIKDSANTPKSFKGRPTLSKDEHA